MNRQAKAISVILVFMLVAGFVLHGHTVDITNVVANPSPGTITVGNTGCIFFDVTIYYTASGFDSDDRMCFAVEFCKDDGDCGDFNDCIEVTGPSGSGSVSGRCDTGGPSFKNYCGSAYLKITVQFYLSDYDPPYNGDTYIVSGYTIDCGCSYSISPSSQVFSSSGGSGAVTVSTSSGCTWEATKDSSWITITSGSSGTGNGTVSYLVSANPGAERTGRITVSGQVHTITQEGINPSLCKSTTSLNFGSSSTSKTFYVWNCDGGTLSYDISDNKGWIRVSPSSGSSAGEHDPIIVTVDRSGLSPGSYSGTVTINSNGGSQTVQVAMDVPAPTPTPHLSRSPSSLDFETSSTSKTFTVWNSGGGTLNYTINDSKNWISVSPTSGSSTGEHDTITVSVNRSGLSEGHYTGTVTINSNGGSQTVQIAMDVPAPTPHLSCSPSSIDFGLSSISATFSIWNSGGGILKYNITTNVDWISVSSSSGTICRTTHRITILIDRSQLLSGEHTGVIKVSSNGGDAMVPVIVQVPCPVLTVSTARLEFGDSAREMSFEVSNSGGGMITFDVRTLNQDGVRVSPKAGTIKGQGQITIHVEIVREALRPDKYERLLIIDPRRTETSYDCDLPLKKVDLSYEIEESSGKIWENGLYQCLGEVAAGKSTYAFIMAGDTGPDVPWTGWLMGTPSVATAGIIRDALDRLQAYPAYNIRYVEFFDATGKSEADFLLAARRVISKVGLGDVLLFYYAGHSDYSGILPGYDSEYNTYSRLFSLFSTLGNEYFIIDGCSSGGALVQAPVSNKTVTVIPTARIGEDVSAGTGPFLKGSSFANEFYQRCNELVQ